MRVKCLLSGAVAVLFLSAVHANAEPLGIGFPAFDEHASIISSNELLPSFVRRAVTAPLATASPENNNFESSSLSDMMTVSPDYSVWSYRLRVGARFGNGSPVTSEDILYSIKKCVKQGTLPALSGIESRSAEEDMEHWIDLRVAQSSVEEARIFPKKMEACPILERKTSLVFGQLLGNGSNLVSAGPYIISTFIPGRKYILDRMRRDPRDRSGAEEFELRSFESPEQGLAALRVGTIVAFATSDEATISRGKGDETLAVEECDGYSVVLRRGAQMSCIENLSAVDIRGNG